VVVDEEGKKKTNKTTLGSKWRSLLKKGLTMPALLSRWESVEEEELTMRR